MKRCPKALTRLTLDDPQQKTVFTVIALMQKKIGLPPTALNVHREFKATDCPDTSLRKDAVIAEVAWLPTIRAF